MDVWEERQQELLNRDDRAGFWLRVLNDVQTARKSEPREDAPSGIPAPQDSLRPALRQIRTCRRTRNSVSRLASMRAAWTVIRLSELGYRGVAMPETMPGREHVAAAMAQQHEFGADARTEYAWCQQAAAQLTRSDRS